jgi:hypothetical protein
MKLDGQILDTAHTSEDSRDEMFALMERAYENVRRPTFEADLDAKDWVIQLRCRDTGRLAGFSTQVMMHVPVAEKLVHALYSGDTVVDRQHWGDPALAHVWGNLAVRIIEKYQPEPLYWLLTSKGFRTYRFLPLFFHEYYPRLSVAIPTWEREVISALGRRIAPHRYDDVRMIIVADGKKDYVRPELGAPEGRVTNDCHVRFFVERNPGHTRGDELCCLAPLSMANFTRAAHRVINAASCGLAIA